MTQPETTGIAEAGGAACADGMSPTAKVTREVQSVLVAPEDRAVVQRVGGAEACQGLTRLYVCPADGAQVEVHAKCDDERGCPLCSHSWAWGEALRATHRLRQGTVWAPRHFVVSFAHHAVRTAQEYDAEFVASWDLLKRLGARGAVLVVHPWRHESEPTGVVWYESAHVHALVIGPVNTWKLGPGAVVVNLDAEQERRTVAGTLKYVLDHAGYVAKRHAIRWYGCVSYNKLHAEPLPGGDGPRCPVCGGPMEAVDRDTGLSPLLEAIRKAGRRRGYRRPEV